MKTNIRKFFAVIMAMTFMLVLAGCNKNKANDLLKTDIIGVWCNIEGPEYHENEGNPYYRLYEFTSAGQFILHTPMAMGSIYTEDTYQINDNYMTVGSGGTCEISIVDDVLTMAYDDGASQYRKMSMEEVCNFGVYYIDSENYEAQLDYLGVLYGTDINGNLLEPGETIAPIEGGSLVLPIDTSAEESAAGDSNASETTAAETTAAETTVCETAAAETEISE